VLNGSSTRIKTEATPPDTTFWLVVETERTRPRRGGCTREDFDEKAGPLAFGQGCIKPVKKVKMGLGPERLFGTFDLE